MPDPIDQTTTNPQSLVDAALTPLEPLAPPVVEPVVAMGDDTPLAFVMPAPSTTETPMAPSPVSEQTSSYLPPVPLAPTMAPEQPKKKNKTGLIIGGVVALLLFVVGGMTGYFYLTYGEVPIVALTKTMTYAEWKEAQAKKNSGYKAQIIAKQAKDQAVYVNNILKNNNITLSGSTEASINASELKPQEKAALLEAMNTQEKLIKKMDDVRNVAPGTTDTSLAGTFGWCYSCNDGKGAMATEKDWNDPNANIAGVYKSSQPSTSTAKVQWVPYSNADTTIAMIMYNSANSGILTNYIVDHSKNSGLETLKLISFDDVLAHPGMTWVPGGVGCVGLTDDDSTAANEATECLDWHWTTCASGGGVNYVGCDVQTTGGGDSEPNEPTPTAPTMSCTGLASSPDVETTTVALGNTITFTCAGAVIPADAGVLSYKYRYSINSGAYTDMTSNTLTIAACGEYSVECQACALMSAAATGVRGQIICDPVWTGATTP